MVLPHSLRNALLIAFTSTALAACDSGAPPSRNDKTQAPTAEQAKAPASLDGEGHLQQGLALVAQAKAQASPTRADMDKLYQQAVDHLEQAKSMLAEDKRPMVLYQALWTAYRERAYLPVTFQQGVDPDQGVIPVNMQWMRKALAVFEEAKKRFPNDSALNGVALEADQEALMKVYATNAERQWKELRESGYRKPEEYSKPSQ